MKKKKMLVTCPYCGTCQFQLIKAGPNLLHCVPSADRPGCGARFALLKQPGEQYVIREVSPRGN